MLLPAAAGHAQTKAVRIGAAEAARAYAEYDQGALNPSTPLHHLMVVLAPGADRQAALEALLRSQQDPRSPHYHRWLTPEQFGERFGATDADAQAVIAWLQAAGMADVAPGRGRMAVTFSGTADAVSRAFQTEIHRFSVNGTDHYANLSAPAIPAEVAPRVADIVGLNDFGMTPQHVTARADYTAAGYTSIAPGDLGVIYGINGLYAQGINGQGVTVAILGRAQSTTLLADYQAYRRTFGLPANDYTMIAAEGSTTGSTDPEDIVEATLDLEVVGAVARNAHILYVWGDTLDAAAYAVIDNDLAPVMSESYAGCELATSAAFYQSMALEASAEGITWLAAAGDSGAAGCDAQGQAQAVGGLQLMAPANAPSITGVGGTTLDTGSGWNAEHGANGATAAGYMGESGWSNPDEVQGGGGGVSTVYAKPGYQSDYLTAAEGRMLPDVAFAASPDVAPYAIVAHGSVSSIGGTSAGTPLFAGIVALLNQYLYQSGQIAAYGLGNVNPALYRLHETAPSIYHDVAAGTNDVPCRAQSRDCAGGVLGYAAGPGYDLATGLGSVDAAELAARWSSASFAPSTATLTLSDAGIAAEQSLTVTAQVQTGAGPLAASPVQFYLVNSSHACGTKSMLLLTTVATDSAGAARYTLNYAPAGSNSIYAYATGKTSVLPAAPASAAVDVTADPATVALKAAGGPYYVGASVMILAKVTPPAGMALFVQDPDGMFSQTGTVSLYSADGVLQSGPSAISADGTAGLFTDALAAGKNSFYVTYSGNCYLAPAQSAPVVLTAAGSPPMAATTTTLTASAPQVTTGASLTFKARVTTGVACCNPGPDGAVTLLANNAAVGLAHIDPWGTATFTYIYDGNGATRFSASYGGNSHYTPSTSSTVIVSEAPPPDYSLEGPASVSLAEGSAALVNLEITPQNGFSNTVALACTGLPAGITCTLPKSVRSATPTRVTMRVSTSAAARALGAPVGALLTVLFAGGKRRRRGLMLLLAAAAVMGMAGCGGRVYLEESRTYTVTVTATSGAIRHQCLVDVIVAQ